MITMAALHITCYKCCMCLGADCLWTPTPEIGLSASESKHSLWNKRNTVDAVGTHLLATDF